MPARVFSRLRKEKIQSTKITLYWVVRPDPSKLTSNWGQRKDIATHTGLAQDLEAGEAGYEDKGRYR